MTRGAEVFAAKGQLLMKLDGNIKGSHHKELVLAITLVKIILGRLIAHEPVGNLHHHHHALFVELT